MLNENQIIEILIKYLENKGFKIAQKRNTSENGIDIIATNLSKNEVIYIEAKGETSSKNNSSRFGLPFDEKQIRNHVSVAIYCALKVLSSKPSGKKTRVGIALPSNRGHEIEIKKVSKVLKSLGVRIYWVGSDTVAEE